MCPDDKKEVSLFVNEYFPEIKGEAPDAARASIYQLMQSAVSFTAARIREHNFGAVKKCMYAVERLYGKGNRLVQNAIENVYVYSLRAMLHTIERTDQQRVHAVIPVGLYTIYMNQLRGADYP